MKTLIALTKFTIAVVAERIIVRKRTAPAMQLRDSELTDEIKRYDNGDLILS
jgi:hypothetical protein